VSTALRFHPVEILLSLLLKIAVVVSLGLAPAGVLIFEIVLNGAAMFNHAKASLSHTLDRIVRLVLVTPSMHRVHHSTFSSDAACNFGFSVSWWDRLFATYRERSLLPQPSIGLPDAPPTPHHVRLPSMLAMPFVSRK
jgi:sterol desaturase/sphingolipid hydroxylase (fatty acid hydroxylase superfamily)